MGNLAVVERVVKPSILYAREPEGLCPVQILGRARGYVLHTATGKVTYPSAHQLLIHLTKHPHGRFWTLDRYFKQGRHRPKRALQGEPVVSVMQILGIGDLALRPIPDSLHPSKNGEIITTVISSLPKLDVQDVITVVPGLDYEPKPRLGIDLQTRGHEVAKLLFAGWGRKIAQAGYDPNDVLQEVFYGILIRNKGICPWDPRKASFGHYVHMICGCVMSNYHRKHAKLKEREQVGVLGWDQHERVSLEVGDSDNGVGAIEYVFGEATDTETIQDLEFFIELHPGGNKEKQLARQILPYLQEGCARAEIAYRLGVGKSDVSKALGFLRQCAREWVLG